MPMYNWPMVYNWAVNYCSDAVVMQYKDTGRVTWLNMETQDVRTQHKDLDEVRDDEGNLVRLKGT